ncbi:small integral membrane protein 24 [Erinaceus europaeus]|uniref:Small integral membrane protein 24 n=1 Tax=Erinaceus europaeus TaxID=9365 RepID=A0ABM3WNS5_ERIEU|nr:small integral membrane protein 24 [Erinaceus europaeus]
MAASGVLLALGALLLPVAAAAQGVRLQPWLVGLAAVVGFLFLVFILMLVNRVWCSKAKPEDEEASDMVRMETHYEEVELSSKDKEKKKKKKEKEEGETNLAVELHEELQAAQGSASKTAF